MKLALEIPTAYLNLFSTLTDFDFALAHLVLADKDYAEHFRLQRKLGRRTILDNGMHENGTSLSAGELIEAAKRINPSVVIPPDKIGDMKYTLQGFRSLWSHPQRDTRWDVALVVQGEFGEERVELFTTCRQHTNTLMLPYREPRFGWLLDLVQRLPQHVKWPQNLHLLGVNNLQELQDFNMYCTGILKYPLDRLYVDTGKPIKWALKGKDLAGLEDLRGGGLLPPGAGMDEQQRSLAYRNIAYLRRFTS